LRYRLGHAVAVDGIKLKKHAVAVDGIKLKKRIKNQISEMPCKRGIKLKIRINLLTYLATDKTFFNLDSNFKTKIWSLKN